MRCRGRVGAVYKRPQTQEGLGRAGDMCSFVWHVQGNASEGYGAPAHGGTSV